MAEMTQAARARLAQFRTESVDNAQWHRNQETEHRNIAEELEATARALDGVLTGATITPA